MTVSATGMGLVLAIAVGVAIGLAPATSTAGNDALKAAREAAAAQDYDAALRWAVQALRETSDAKLEVKIFQVMAFVYSRTDRPADATDMYFEILVREPDFDLPADAPEAERGALAAARVATQTQAGNALVKAAPVAQGQPATSEAASLFAEAQRGYEELNYEKVMPALRRALELTPPPELEVRIYALMAYLAMSQGRPKQARRNFVRVLERDPDFALPARSSPKLVAVLDDAKAELRATAAAALAPPADTCPQASSASGWQPEAVGDCVTCGAIYNQWWFWTIIGVAVAGGAAGATVAVTQTGTLPPHNYGPIELR